MRTPLLFAALGLTWAGCAESPAPLSDQTQAVGANCSVVAGVPLSGDFELTYDEEFGDYLLVTNVGNGYELDSTGAVIDNGPRPIKVYKLDDVTGQRLAGPETIADNYYGWARLNGPEFVRSDDLQSPVGLGVVFPGPDGVHAAFRQTGGLFWSHFEFDGGATPFPVDHPPALPSTSGLQPGATPSGVSAGRWYLSFNPLHAAVDAGADPALSPLPLDLTHPCGASYCLGRLDGGTKTPVGLLAQSEFASVGAMTIHPAGPGVVVAACRPNDCGVYQAFADGVGGLTAAPGNPGDTAHFQRLGVLSPGNRTLDLPRESLRAAWIDGVHPQFVIAALDPAAQEIKWWRLAWVELPLFPHPLPVPPPLIAGYYAWDQFHDTDVSQLAPEHLRFVEGDGELVLDFQDRSGRPLRNGSYGVVYDGTSVAGAVRYSSSSYATELTYMPNGAGGPWAAFTGDQSAGTIEVCWVTFTPAP